MAKSSKKEEKDTKSAAKDVKKKEADTSTHAAQQKVAEQKAPKNSSKKTRTETDLLGSMEVPNNAYYGVHTLRAESRGVLHGAAVAHGDDPAVAEKYDAVGV